VNVCVHVCMCVCVCVFACMCVYSVSLIEGSVQIAEEGLDAKLFERIGLSGDDPRLFSE